MTEIPEQIQKSLSAHMTFHCENHTLFNPIRPGLFLGAWVRGGGRKVPRPITLNLFIVIEMRFGRIVENHKPISLV